VQRTLQIMDAQNLIELPLKVNGLEVKIKPVSPIAQSQNNQDINNVVQFAQIVSQLGPEGQTILKIGKIADYIAEKLGIPADLTNSEAERAIIVQQTQELIQQQAEAEQAMQQPEEAPTEEQI